jgi:cytochrome b561
MEHSANYTRTAIALHWLVAFALVATFSVGFYMHDLPLSPIKLKIYSWHKWAGVTIFLLACFRLGWRFTHRPPGPPSGMPAWQHTAAEVVHLLIYVLMFAIPLSGWLMSSAKGFQTVYFGILPIPDLLAKDKELGDLLSFVHKMLNFTLAGVVVAHAGAAFKHHFIDRDDVLTRMLPFLRKV